MQTCTNACRAHILHSVCSFNVHTVRRILLIFKISKLKIVDCEQKWWKLSLPWSLQYQYSHYSPWLSSCIVLFTLCKIWRSNFGSLTSGRSAPQSIYYFIFRLLPLSCICVTQISESCCVMFTMKTDIFQCNLAFVFFCHVAQGEGFCQAFSRDTQGPRLRVRV